jgi:hypothetical protein
MGDEDMADAEDDLNICDCDECKKQMGEDDLNICDCPDCNKQ